jgi:ubiquinone biosynthesis protein
MLLPGERIAFIDFGMVGRVSEARRRQLTTLLQALLQSDAEGLSAILLEWSGREGDDPGELSGAVEEFLGRYGGKSMGLMDLSAMVGDLWSLIRDHKLTMPPDEAMLLKVFVSLEGSFRKLDPAFDIMVAIQPTLHEAVIDQLSPLALGKRGLKILTQYLELFADLPKEVRRGIYSAKTGTLKIRVEVSQSEQLGGLVARATHLVAVAAIASGLLIAGSIVMSFAKKPKQ